MRGLRTTVSGARALLQTYISVASRLKSMPCAPSPVRMNPVSSQVSASTVCTPPMPSFVT